MNKIQIKPKDKIHAVIVPPPDKSISHRALILPFLAHTPSRIHNLLYCDDVHSTLDVLKKLGARFQGDFRTLEIFPPGHISSHDNLYCGNSGTTARIISGVLASRKGDFRITGDDSLSRRPMMRIVKPLEKMGATIEGAHDKNNLPLLIHGMDRPKAIHWHNGESSAQVKSAILLAGLSADGETTTDEPFKSRDHTEKMLSFMGADITVSGTRVAICPSILNGIDMEVPGDFSSASFFLALGAVHPHAEISVEGVLLNPTRTGFLNILNRMGAHLEVNTTNAYIEPMGNVCIQSSMSMKGTEISSTDIPSLIDELPLIALLGTAAEGITVVRGAKDLRVKESDRITALCKGFTDIGVEIQEFPDGFLVHGPQKIRGGKIESYGDHRIAMLFAICGLLSSEGIEISNCDCVSVSFPHFFDIIS